eukprot:5181209-Amphidinium_carterae.1
MTTRTKIVDLMAVKNWAPTWGLLLQLPVQVTKSMLCNIVGQAAANKSKASSHRLRNLADFHTGFKQWLANNCAFSSDR